MATQEIYDSIKDVIPIGRMGANNPRANERQTLYGDVLDWLRDNGYGKDRDLAVLIIGNYAVSVNWCGTIDVPLDGRTPVRCQQPISPNIATADMADAFLSSLDNVSSIRRQLEEEQQRLLCLLIANLVGQNNALCFDDTTGFVHFHDHTTDETFYIVAVRVTGNNGMTIEFNDTPDEDSETGLNETGWFVPGSRGNEGDYSISQLLSCIRAYAQERQ